MTPRKFDSEIRINKAGKWIYRGQEITQDKILDFFKKNIKEDEKGIFIKNSYSELEEHGYIEAKSIFLSIINYIITDNSTYLHTEDDRHIPLKDLLFYSDDESKIFCMIKSDKFIKFRFNRKTHTFISTLISEENGNYFITIDNEKQQILPYDKEINVQIPEF